MNWQEEENTLGTPCHGAWEVPIWPLKDEKHFARLTAGQFSKQSAGQGAKTRWLTFSSNLSPRPPSSCMPKLGVLNKLPPLSEPQFAHQQSGGVGRDHSDLSELPGVGSADPVGRACVQLALGKCWGTAAGEGKGLKLGAF